MMPVKRKSAFSAKSVAKAAAAVTPTKSEVTSTPPPSKSEYDVINQINGHTLVLNEKFRKYDKNFISNFIIFTRLSKV